MERCRHRWGSCAGEDVRRTWPSWAWRTADDSIAVWELGNEGRQAQPHGLADLPELHHVQAPDPMLDIADKGLQLADRVRQIDLGQLRRSPGMPQLRAQDSVLGHGEVSRP